MIFWRGWAPLLAVALSSVRAPVGAPPTAPYRVVPLGRGVYAVPGDTGRGSEGRPNAGFVVTDSGVAVIEALGSPYQGKRLLASVRTITPKSIRYLILTHHHPDHTFGAIVFKRTGARVVANPNRTMLAAENGDDDLVANWDRVVGVRELQGFVFADTPDIPVIGDTTLVLGGRRLVIGYQPNAHTVGDLTVWIPDARVLFAGDLLVEDGVTMVVDGSSAGVLAALTRLAQYGARIVVPGHGRMVADPAAQIAATRLYLDSARTAMQDALSSGRPLSRVLARMPPPDTARPVSIASRRQRNAVVIYEEMEKALMDPPAPARPMGLISTDTLAAHAEQYTIVDVRTDIGQYLKSHIPGAVYLNSETMRSFSDGVPNLLLPAESYAIIFTRLGIRPGRTVVVYSAGETRDIDATYLAWILGGFNAPVLVLNGGFSKWELEQRPESRTYPPAVPGTYPQRAFTPDKATRADVERVVRRHPADAALVDARPPDQYAGLAGAQIRRGHIPGAISHYWATDLRDDLTHAFKDSAALAASYQAQGITPDKDLILYCNGALESSHIYFVLHALLGYPRVRIYDGSWTDWSEQAQLPIATGPTP
jgi:thiosulfate/3-mercaptopyruvate sulfurtransferase